jgi:hypothetical protein
LKVTVDQPEGMIFYLKGRFLPSGAPRVAEQLLFDWKLIDAGIVDEEGKGPRYADLLQSTLAHPAICAKSPVVRSGPPA